MIICGLELSDVRRAMAWRYRQSMDYKHRLIDRGIVSVVDVTKHWISMGRPS